MCIPTFLSPPENTGFWYHLVILKAKALGICLLCLSFHLFLLWVEYRHNGGSKKPEETGWTHPVMFRRASSCCASKYFTPGIVDEQDWENIITYP